MDTLRPNRANLPSITSGSTLTAKQCSQPTSHPQVRTRNLARWHLDGLLAYSRLSHAVGSKTHSVAPRNMFRAEIVWPPAARARRSIRRIPGHRRRASQLQSLDAFRPFGRKCKRHSSPLRNQVGWIAGGGSSSGLCLLTRCQPPFTAPCMNCRSEHTPRLPPTKSMLLS